MHHKKWLRIIGVIVAIAAVVIYIAKTTQVKSEKQTMAVKKTIPTIEPTQAPPTVIIQNTKEHLAEKLHVDVQDITVAGYKKVEWNDTSLGCPKAGNYYSQVIVPGYSITLEHKSKEYEYHTDEKTSLETCE